MPEETSDDPNADPGTDRTPDQPSDPKPKPDPVDARRQLKRGFMRPTRSQLIVGLLLACLGFGAVTQVRSNDLDNAYASYRQDDLVNLLDSLFNSAQRAQREIAVLEETRDELQSTTGDNEAAIVAAQRAADNLEILAGTVPVSGPGLRITITEQDGPVDLNSLLDTVQELRTADAEAMEFNDEVRAIATTHFDTGAQGVQVDGVPIPSPIVIDVIGEPTTLEEGLKFPRGPLEQLRDDDGAEVVVEQLELVEITSVVPAERPEYAQPANGQ